MMRIYWEEEKLIVNCEGQRMYFHPDNPLEKLPDYVTITDGTFDGKYIDAGMSTIDLYKMISKRMKRKRA